MATKINPDFYGAENTFVTLSSGNVKIAAHNLNWYGNNNIYTGGDWDTSAAPWGIGRSSLSSNTIQVPTIGQEWVINQHENEKVNNPLFMYRNTSDISGAFGLRAFTGASATWSNYAKALYKCRYSPSAHTSVNSVLSDFIIDENQDITIASCYDNYPVCYADYSKLRLAIGWIQYKPTNSDEMTRVNTLAAFLAANNCDYVTQVTFDIYNTDRSQCGFYTSIGGVGLEMPEIFKTRYYGENVNTYVRPWKFNDTFIGNWSGSADTTFHRENTTDHFSYTSAWETLSGDNDVFPPFPNILCAMATNMSKHHQIFDDVSYHWEYGICPMLGSGHNFDIHPIRTGDIYTSGTVQAYCYMELDSYDGLSKTQAYGRAILHEMAFMGFAIVGDVWDCGESIGSNNVYLPVFDDHMITTGEYLQGAASLNLPNATWRDVFSVDMPDYDPNYIPPEPVPDQGDTGDLDNQQLHNLRYDGSNNYYLLNESELTQFIGFINGLYSGESDPEKQRSIDFMGSNPTDYIVGIYGCGIELTGGATTSIKLGAVDTADAGIYGRAVPTNLTYVNFGNYDIPAYGNFLDFKPYTTIEVYVPLCGTIEVDPGEYIGHNLKVDGLIDFQTGELTARIVRDGKTVTNTLTGSMWVQLPVTAARMGDYQNNQHQLRMQMLSSVLSFGQSSANAINSDVQSAAGVIAGSAAGGSPTALATPGKAQFTIPQNAASAALSLYNTHYQITHTQPARATASSASSGNALEMYHHAMIFIKRPTFLDGYDLETYAHTIGHACCISAQLSSFSGYTVFSAADLDNIHTKRALDPLQATAQEKQLLKQALQAGIYINTISPE